MSSEDQIFFEMSKTVQIYHSGASGLATLTALCRFAQESAGFHADKLGFGMMRLAQQKTAWVLREQAMYVKRFPALGETVRVFTWPRQAERILCHRDYRIVDTAGEVVALGTSAWFGLDLENRRPRKADSFFHLDWQRVPGPALDDPLPELAAPEDASSPDSRTVMASDVDALGHMNNLRYLDWIWDHLQSRMPDRGQACGVRIRHAREVTAGNAVGVTHSVDPSGDVLVRMNAAGQDKEVCLARVSYRQ